MIDKAIVKGKSVPLELFEVQHAHSPVDADGTFERYAAAFAKYEEGDFEEAGRMFTVIRDERQDKPSALMAERCRELQTNPPGSWDGIYQLSTK